MTPKKTVLLLCLALLAAPALAATYKVDGGHSSAVFKIQHFGAGNFYGIFDTIEGTIEYDAGNPGASSIEISIAADSVQSRIGRRDDHIKSPDFLDAKQFPKITFKSKSVKKGKDDTFEITGDLTLHGVTREITLTAEKTGEGKNPRSGAELIGFEARFSVDRAEYDMNFMVGPLGKEVGFIIALEAGKQ